MNGGGGGGSGSGYYEKSKPKKLTEDEKTKLNKKSSEESKKIEEYIEKAKTENRNNITTKIISENDGNLGIVYLDVGQGDCSVIKFPNGEIMVIDCNIKDANIDIVDFLQSAGVSRIDYLVITHPHYDHTSGIRDISNNFQVGELWVTRFERRKSQESQESWEKYQDFCKVVGKLNREGTKMVYPSAKNEPFREIGDSSVQCFGPSASYDNNRGIHTHSMVLKINRKDFGALFTGDVDKESWDRITTHYNIKSTVATASHHGSETGYDSDAQNKINAKYTIISTGNKKLEENTIRDYRKKSKTYKTRDGSIGIIVNEDGKEKVIEG